MKRRLFLQLAAGSASSVLLTRCAANETLGSLTSGTPATLQQESTIQSINGVLETILVAEQQQVSLAGRSASLMTYNGQNPGPMISVNPGDTVRIRLVNRLSQPTNLHYHGLHISPEGKQDNPFLSVAPGETFDYEFVIPADHPTGMFWYHPHRHGYVAEQVASGLAGLFIVREAPDTRADLQNAEEFFAVLQDFEVDDRGNLVPPMPMWAMWGREGTLLTVNGQDSPVIPITEQGLLRLRVLNASASRIYRLSLDDHPLHLMALDGMTLPDIRPVTELLLSPGQRAEVWVKGDRPVGNYALKTLPYDRGITTMMTDMMGGSGMQNGKMDQFMGRMQQTSDEPQTLAMLEYGDRQNPPASLSTVPLAPYPSGDVLPDPDTTREFIFDHGMDIQTGAAFLINGKGFDPNRIDVSTSLNQVEDWVLVNKAGMDHPFHLHVHPFQVISRNGQPEPTAIWRDTVMVKAYETVTIRIWFKDNPGKTVYHCHILDHEDKGMMGIIEVTA
jgi:FtsP/CotA-like multicopper oxidase with cupredoxin domain